MLFIVVLIVSLVLLVVFGDVSKDSAASARSCNSSRKNPLLWPLMIIGSIIYFPIAVILALTKKYK